MSKVQSSVRKYFAEFGENIFACDGGILFYKVCEIKVNSLKRFTVTQHLKTDKHIRAVHRKNENKSKFQQLLANIPDKSMFAKDLCNTLLLGNYLWKNWEIDMFVCFLKNIQQLNAEDAICIEKVKKIMLEENILEADLVFIYSNYGILKAAITNLEKQCLPLADSIKIVENIENKVK
ncbi:hypothetical protein QTP88_023484 [Uroleucon formosanum]